MNLATRGLTAVAAAATLALAGCASSDPLGSAPATTSPSSAAAPTTLVVGSQQYYSNEIIAELYAQALEDAGYTIDRQYQIGQREAYMPEIVAGEIDVFPEYSGNLLQYLDKDTDATSRVDVITALQEALPDGLRALNAAEATDQDSYNVTMEFAQQHGVVSLEDLAKVPGTIKVAANSEFATRPYGPPGLRELYGIDVEVVPVEDSGGPLTVKALKDGTVQAADIYSADPAIATNGFVTLTDPKDMILPQNVVPIVSAKVDETAAEVIEGVNERLSTAELVALNQRSVQEQASSEVIAKEWLAKEGIVS